MKNYNELTAEIRKGGLYMNGVAAILSFFIPGLGQLVKGQILKAIGFFFGTFIGLAFFVIPGIAIWAWGIVDAYQEN